MQIVMLRVPTLSTRGLWIQATEIGLIEAIIARIREAYPSMKLRAEERTRVEKRLRSCQIESIKGAEVEVGDQIIQDLISLGYQLRSGTIIGDGMNVPYPIYCSYCFVKE